MSKSDSDKPLTREKLASLLNKDLAREYQAIISYVVFSQVLKGAEYMNIANQLQQHATEELNHALTILAADRLSWCDADGAAQSRKGLGQSEGNAAL